MKKFFYILSITFLFFTACTSTPSNQNVSVESPAEQIIQEETEEKIPKDDNTPRDSITLLFGGDIMAHWQNYVITTYEKIWRDVKYFIQPCDLAFANIEAPIDTTKESSSYPNFNMTQKYVQASVDAGFDVFSLCNNHTNDQALTGIKETIKTTNKITEYEKSMGHKVYFSGLKETPESAFSYNIIERYGWKILFLPITEILNRPDYASYINYVKTDSTSRQDFIKFIRELKAKNPCDLFILSVHAYEPEYTRVVTDEQNQYYKDLLNAGVDVVWANHAHIIKDRKVIVDTKENRDKIIMYANGNTISAQRRNPDLSSKNPNGEWDNTGDGLLYKVTLKKDNKGSVKIQKAEPFFITTYINTANEFVIKPLNQDFVDYLYEVPRNNWAKYIERRIKINQDVTKDLIEWQ